MRVVQEAPACAEIGYFFLVCSGTQVDPLERNRVQFCRASTCNGRRIGQDHPGKLKLGPMALPRAVYRTYSRVLKSDAHFQFAGAPKMTPWMNFRYATMLWPTSQMLHTPAQFVGHGRMLNVFFGSSQTEHWLPRYGHFKFRGIEELSLLVVCSWFTCLVRVNCV